MMVKTDWLPYNLVSGEVTRLSYIEMNRIVSNFIYITKKFYCLYKKFLVRDPGQIRKQENFAFIDYILYIELNLKDMFDYFELEFEYRDDYKKYGDRITFKDINRIESNIEFLNNYFDEAISKQNTNYYKTGTIYVSNYYKFPVYYITKNYDQEIENTELVFVYTPKDIPKDTIKIAENYLELEYGTDYLNGKKLLYYGQISHNEDESLIAVLRENDSEPLYYLGIDTVKLNIKRYNEEP